LQFVLKATSIASRKCGIYDRINLTQFACGCLLLSAEYEKSDNPYGGNQRLNILMFIGPCIIVIVE
jgi:hypothetical protein